MDREKDIAGIEAELKAIWGRLKEIQESLEDLAFKVGQASAGNEDKPQGSPWFARWRFLGLIFVVLVGGTLFHVWTLEEASNVLRGFIGLPAITSN